MEALSYMTFLYCVSAVDVIEERVDSPLKSNDEVWVTQCRLNLETFLISVRVG